jgi:hypothetical protein
MFTPGFDLLGDHKMRYQAFLREAQQHRLVQEALKAQPRRANSLSKFLVIIGKWLVLVGGSLEKHFDCLPQTEAHLAYNSSSYNGC